MEYLFGNEYELYELYELYEYEYEYMHSDIIIENIKSYIWLFINT